MSNNLAVGTSTPNFQSNPFILHSQLAHDCIELAYFPLCKLLCNDCSYPCFILVPKVADVSDIYQLDWSQQQQLLKSQVY